MDPLQIAAVTSLFFVIPAYTQIQNYRKTKSPSYLVFGSLFLLSIINQIVVILDESSLLVQVSLSLSFVFVHSILLYLALELNDNELFLSVNMLKTIPLLTILSLVVLKLLFFFKYVSEDYWSIIYVIGEPFRIIVGMSLIFAGIKLTLSVESRRTIFVKRGWLIAGIVLTSSGVIQFGLYGLELINHLFSSPSNSILVDIAVITSWITIFLLAFYATVIALFFPESMLLSQTQILKAVNLYKIISDVDSTTQELTSRDVLMEYIRKIPQNTIFNKRTDITE